MSTAAANGAAGAEASPPKKSKLPLIIALIVLLAAGGGGAWYYMKMKAAAEAEDEEAPAKAAKKSATDKPPVFVPLDQFTVNLQPEDGAQFLQVAMTLRVADPTVVDAVKLHMPEVRSRVLLLLSAKKASQLSTPAGKEDLADEVATQIESVISPPAPVKKKGKKKARDEEDDEDEEEEAKPKKAKKKAKPRRNPEDHRVQSVFFTHFIVQ